MPYKYFFKCPNCESTMDSVYEESPEKLIFSMGCAWCRKTNMDLIKTKKQKSRRGMLKEWNTCAVCQKNAVEYKPNTYPVCSGCKKIQAMESPA